MIDLGRVISQTGTFNMKVIWTAGGSSQERKHSRRTVVQQSPFAGLSHSFSHMQSPLSPQRCATNHCGILKTKNRRFPAMISTDAAILAILNAQLWVPIPGAAQVRQ